MKDSNHKSIFTESLYSLIDCNLHLYIFYKLMIIVNLPFSLLFHWSITFIVSTEKQRLFDKISL